MIEFSDLPLTIIEYDIPCTYSLEGKSYTALRKELVVYFRKEIRYCTRKNMDLGKIDKDIRNSDKIYRHSHSIIAAGEL